VAAVQEPDGARRRLDRPLRRRQGQTVVAPRNRGTHQVRLVLAGRFSEVLAATMRPLGLKLFGMFNEVGKQCRADGREGDKV
jgi:hypothetical protein